MGRTTKLTATAAAAAPIRFNGLITTYFLPPVPGTAFQLKQVYRARPRPSSRVPAKTSSANNHDHDHDHDDDHDEVANAYRGPPMHFHAHQTERFRVERGRIGIEQDGKSIVVGPEDGVVVCRAGTLHRFWVDVEGEDGGEQEDVVLLLNATDSGKDFVLDRVFFENWYGMRYDSLMFGQGIDLVQMLCVSERFSRCCFDHYVSPHNASLRCG